MVSKATGPILVVDDDPDVREATSMLLRLRGYDVLEAEHGGIALEVMRRQRPAALVLDLTMPVMDGWTLRREMHADPALASIPVVVVSGVADIGPELRDCAVLKKPVDVDHLAAAVERCVS
jgi:CheY-like chemotaxis protein